MINQILFFILFIFFFFAIGLSTLIEELDSKNYSTIIYVLHSIDTKDSGYCDLADRLTELFHKNIIIWPCPKMKVSQKKYLLLSFYFSPSFPSVFFDWIDVGGDTTKRNTNIWILVGFLRISLFFELLRYEQNDFKYMWFIKVDAGNLKSNYYLYSRKFYNIKIKLENPSWYRHAYLKMILKLLNKHNCIEKLFSTNSKMWRFLQFNTYNCLDSLSRLLTFYSLDLHCHWYSCSTTKLVIGSKCERWAWRVWNALFKLI